MTEQNPTILLSIREAEEAGQPVFLFDVLVNEDVIASNQSLSAAESQSARELSRRYNLLFEQHYAPPLASDALKSVGAELFNLWLSRVWDKVREKCPPGSGRLLAVASDVADVLNLPWELLRPAGGEFVGLDAKFNVRRLPWHDRRPAAYTGALRPRPLRVLFMACAPKDQHPLDYEREEEALLKVIAKAGPNVVFDSGDMGTFDELREWLDSFDPHVVHLTGHGVVRDDGLGYFCFEDEKGQTDLRSSEELRGLLAGTGVQCAFVSGCQTGKAPPIAALGGICQGLVSEEVPLAIGWAASIADDIATEFASTLYTTLAAGQSINRALAQARRAIFKKCEERGYPGWTLPVLYGATTQALLFDQQRPPVPPPTSSAPQLPLPGMKEGYTEHFVGRRREIQRLLPALREGALQVVLLTGMGGAGKSTLATRIARKLEAAGFKPIPISGTKENPLSTARLFEACGDAFLDVGLREELATLRDPNLSERDRLRYIVSVLNRSRFVLVLDNFEVNLNEDTRRIISKDLAEFYTTLLNSLAGGSRAIITCRYQPADVPNLPPTVREETLEDFPESAFLKFMLRDPLVERRYYNGDYHSDQPPRDLLRELHRLLGGTPRFLAQTREWLKTITADELQQALSNIELPQTGGQNALREARNRYCEEIITARLYGYLNTDSRRALSRAAVFGVPVNLDALAAVTGETTETLRAFTQQWQDYALAYPERERVEGTDLWTIYGLLRGWLLEPERLTTDDRQSAHQAAGDFLRDLVKQKRAGDLGLTWIDCLLEARAQYLATGDYEEARAATARLSAFYVRQGLYEEVVKLNSELLAYEEHPRPMSWIGRASADQAKYPEAREWYQRCLMATENDISEGASDAWHGLATIDMNEGNHAAAREKFQKALEIEQQSGDRAGEAATWHQLASIDLEENDYAAAREKSQRALETFKQIGNRVGEAATWHQLASIDMNEGDYAAAREKFRKSLEIKQQIGDRAGEAQTFYQLGALAWKMGRLAEGMRLVALGFLILKSIGHGSTEIASRNLTVATSQLNYTQEQFDSMLRQVAESYQADRGQSLLRDAFGEG
jgi:tetratricopeptide (TPR) repeat protein